MRRYKPSQIPLLPRFDLPAYRNIIRPWEVTAESREILERAKGNGLSLIEETLSWIHERVERVTDRERFGVPDLWLTPRQTLQNGAGDCEDIAGLFLSIMQNFDVDELLMVIGVNEGEDHAWAVGTDESTGVSYLVDAVFEDHIFRLEDTIKEFEPAIYINQYGFVRR